MPFVRRLANELGTRTFSWAVGRHVADNQSGYRLIAAPLMRRLLDSQETGFEFEVEIDHDRHPRGHGHRVGAHPDHLRG